MAKSNILDIVSNSPNVHQDMIEGIEQQTNRNLICYYALSDNYEAALSDEDSEMIEQVLRFTKDLYGNKIDLLIQSPGGDPIAAGEIVKNIRAYYKGEFRVIIPNSAMSAATMVAMGADTIVMSDTSKLGPIDPQMVVSDPKRSFLQPAWSFVNTYNELIKNAREDIKEGLKYSPYLHLLNNQNASFISLCIQARKSAEILAEDIMKNGVMKDKSEEKIKVAVKEFINRGEELSHGMYIRYQEAINWGLNITHIDKYSPLWNDIWELYTRISRLAMRDRIVKYLAYRDDSYSFQPQ